MEAWIRFHLEGREKERGKGGRGPRGAVLSTALELISDLAQIIFRASFRLRTASQSSDQVE